MSKKKKSPAVADEIIANEAKSLVSTDENGSSEEDKSSEEDLIELDPIKILEKDLQKTKDDLAEQKDSFIRLQAETDNFRKRLSREKEEFTQYANERLFKELIPIFDNLKRAIEDPSNDTKSLKEGLEMILKQFSSFLEKEKVEPIKAVGEKFDPTVHEALTSEESDEHDENIIISEFVKGYTINNRVLRPSQVIISKKPSPAESEEKSKEESEKHSDEKENSTD
mgnify:CR=1 FL=1